MFLQDVPVLVRWATAAWRQYRAVVAWKQDVVTILRKAEEPLRRGRKAGKLTQAIDQTLVMLQQHPRPLLRLGKAAGQPVDTDKPRCPENGEVFIGHCLHVEAAEGSSEIQRGHSG